MKAVTYFTLLDGLLATAVYHPHNSTEYFQTPFSWSVPINRQAWSAPPGSIGTTVTWIPRPTECLLGISGEKGMRTSATPVCGYRSSLYG
jgi:hypothetical protein